MIIILEISIQMVDREERYFHTFIHLTHAHTHRYMYIEFVPVRCQACYYYQEYVGEQKHTISGQKHTIACRKLTLCGEGGIN